MNTVLRFVFLVLIIRPILAIILGMNVRAHDKLPRSGPAIIIANHNSHLDALVLLSLMPAGLLPRVHPVAAADYFLRNKLMAWFALKLIGIVPLNRKRRTPDEDLLAPCSEALQRGDILIFFPEGSRGEPEVMAKFKSGLARIVERHPRVPVTPVYLHGLGKALPKGEALLVPLMLDVFVGDPVAWSGDARDYMERVNQSIEALAASHRRPEWE